MKPVVVRSVNDDTESRCVDIRQQAEGYSFVECRRDPEDSHGWRVILGPHGGFDSADQAWEAAVRAVGWIKS